MAKAWRERVVIPTYEVGMEEKNPMFLEKRVYQGSSGAVYPYPVIESISDEKHDREWEAVFLENEYIKVMVLPQLGGRIQMAYDKIRQRHFVYYNHVIKPALVGLAGPWISGGIEFNWPQHHRPSTYMPVDSTIEEHPDGSVTVWVNELERMTHQKGMAAFTLRPGCACLEITGRLYNPTPLPQTFLWWANPAVAVNDHYRSVFPPDINAVFDHGKRAVSSFPVATGTYYKMDYSAGVDIANYKNIFVPTSYMGVNSRYDFEGGYEFDTEAGMLHVASHHVSPGKKQWTWGNGDFGRAWDRNLTDDDGPYIELMAGVYTENQPDFTWLMPYEEKEFTQYFLPYRELGVVKNASRDLLMNIRDIEGGKAEVKMFATRRQDVTVVVTADDGAELCRLSAVVSPEDVWHTVFDLRGRRLDGLTVEILSGGRTALSWHAEADEIRPVPPAAEAALRPVEIKTNEQLYLTGLHLEQYRHATFNPVDYYEEALRRDPDDYRCNNALGLWYLRRGRFALAAGYLEKAVKVITRRNPNPYDGEPIYNLGQALKFMGRYDEAYARFQKAAWNGAWQDAAYLECARISSMQGRVDDALYESERSLLRNARNHKARALRCVMLHEAGRSREAMELCRESLETDHFNYVCLLLAHIITADSAFKSSLTGLMHGSSHNYDEVGLELLDAGLPSYALRLWDIAAEEGAVGTMTHYYRGLAHTMAGDSGQAATSFLAGAAASPEKVFPNTLHAILALQEALKVNPSDANAHHILGNIYYDKRQHEVAASHWEEATRLRPTFPTSFRNLALAVHNKRGDYRRALTLMEEAFRLDPSDARVLMELDQLYKRHGSEPGGKTPARRLELLRQYPSLVESRDDLVLEEITLLNLTGHHAEARDRLDSRIFHPWEGGEGKVSAQYQTARVELAKEAMAAGEYARAVSLLEECLVYPPHLGEGKLHGAQDNDFNYLLGLCHRALGNLEEAQDAFRRATEGPLEPAAAMYYNDARPDKIFYAGMAWRALGEEGKARAYFNRLVNYGRQHFHDQVEMDYFAVSLPDLLIWEGDLTESNRLHCLYLLALGEYGLGNTERSARYLDELSRADICHQGAMAFVTFTSLRK